METKKLLQHAMQKIRNKREEFKWSQGHLAKLCGWENAAGRVSNYENLSREPTLDDLCRMAEAIKLPLSEILFGEAWKNKIDGIELPILVMDEMDDWINGRLSSISRTLKMRISDISFSSENHKFVILVVDDDSMESPTNQKKSICEGDLITVDLDIKPNKKDIVVALIKGQAVVREYIKLGEKFLLKPLNPSYPTVEVDDFTKIIGIVIEKKVSYKETN